MKKYWILLVLCLIVFAVSGCPEQKFPQGKQAPPKDATNKGATE